MFENKILLATASVSKKMPIFTYALESIEY